MAGRVREDQRAGRSRADVAAEPLAVHLIAMTDGLQVQWLRDPSLDTCSALRRHQYLAAAA